MLISLAVVLFDGEMSKSIKGACDIITRALIVSDILTFELFDLEKVSRSWSTTFKMAPFCGSYQNL